MHVLFFSFININTPMFWVEILLLYSSFSGNMPHLLFLWMKLIPLVLRDWKEDLEVEFFSEIYFHHSIL